MADIVLVAQTQAPVEDVAELIKSFAKRHAPNFSESHWDDYMHKKQLQEQK